MNCSLNESGMTMLRSEANHGHLEFNFSFRSGLMSTRPQEIWGNPFVLIRRRRGTSRACCRHSQGNHRQRGDAFERGNLQVSHVRNSVIASKTSECESGNDGRRQDTSVRAAKTGHIYAVQALLEVLLGNGLGPACV